MSFEVDGQRLRELRVALVDPRPMPETVQAVACRTILIWFVRIQESASLFTSTIYREGLGAH